MATLQHRASSNTEDWVLVQKKTFQRWANSYLTKRQAEVQDIAVDFQDGTKLATLLEVISNEKLSKINATPKIEIQKLENLNKCLQFLKDKEIHLVNIGSQDIFKGNEKLILGLLWTIILRFEVGDQEGKNVRFQCIYCCNRGRLRRSRKRETNESLPPKTAFYRVCCSGFSVAARDTRTSTLPTSRTLAPTGTPVSPSAPSSTVTALI